MTHWHAPAIIAYESSIRNEYGDVSIYSQGACVLNRIVRYDYGVSPYDAIEHYG